MLNQFNGLFFRRRAAGSWKSLKMFSSGPSNKIYDVVISGGGPVGASLAAALCRLDYFSSSSAPKILVLDKAPSPKIADYFLDSKKIPDHRVITLTPASIRFLKSIKMWEHLNPNRLTSFNRMQVWEEQGTNFFSLEDPNKEDMGVVIEVQHLVAALYRQLESCKACEIKIPSSVEAMENTPSNYLKLKLDNNDEIHTRLLVGSEGRGSKVKQLAGISTHGWSYNQMGIVCTIRTNLKQEKSAWQRFLKEGPLGLLPMWDDFYSIVWTVGLAKHEQLMKLNDEDFLREINYVLSKQSAVDTISVPYGSSGYQYPPLITQICNKRLSFPLSSLQSRRFIEERVALIGDAAHSMHPLAGQGLNMGLGDTAILANTIGKNIRVGNDIGNKCNLEDFEYDSKMMNYTMTAGVEAVKFAYSVNNYPFTFARNLGVSVLNSFDFLKSATKKVADGHFFLPEKYEWERS